MGWVHFLSRYFGGMLLLKQHTKRAQSCNGPVACSLKCSTRHRILIFRIIFSTFFFQLVCCFPMTVESLFKPRWRELSEGQMLPHSKWHIIFEDLNSTKNSPVDYVRKWKSLTEVAECGQLPGASVLALFGQNLEPFVFY